MMIADADSAIYLLRDSLGDVSTQRIDGVTGVDAERRRQDGGVGDVEPLHVPGATSRIHQLAVKIPTERTTAHGMTARDLDALLAHEVETTHELPSRHRRHDLGVERGLTVH